MNYLLQELNISTNYERICLQCGRQRIHPWVREDPLENQMATHSSILAWEISWTEEPDRLQSMELQRVRHDWATNTFTSLTLEKIMSLISPQYILFLVILFLDANLQIISYFLCLKDFHWYSCWVDLLAMYYQSLFVKECIYFLFLLKQQQLLGLSLVTMQQNWPILGVYFNVYLHITISIIRKKNITPKHYFIPLW